MYDIDRAENRFKIVRLHAFPANESEYAISIPGYVLCGSGSGAHYEYEITISLDADKWSILRRYSRFREMHLAMRRLYGDAVSYVQMVWLSWTFLNVLLSP